MNLSWHEAAKLKVGDRVVFPDGWDIFPFARVGEGEVGTIVDQRLATRDGLLGIKPDNADIREALDDWDGDIILSHDDAGSDWTKPSPIARVENAAKTEPEPASEPVEIKCENDSIFPTVGAVIDALSKFDREAPCSLDLGDWGRASPASVYKSRFGGDEVKIVGVSTDV